MTGFSAPAKSIYVQIPAYRDTELVPTLFDLLETADDPDSLRIAIFWQRAEEDEMPDALRRHPCVELIERDYRESQGCNWARAELQRRWKGEPHTLLLDSHHRFVPGWDRHLVGMYERLKAGGVAKPFITAYLPPYDPAGDPGLRSGEPLAIEALGRERGLLVYLVARPIPEWPALRGPVPAKFTSLHFAFTCGRFNEEIVHDPDVYFFGDEVVLALRAFTHGYDLFHPERVLGWHLYDRTATRTTHWEDHVDHARRDERSCERMRDIFLGVDDDALGAARTLEAYEAMIADRLVQA
jgi:hypothetical protein